MAYNKNDREKANSFLTSQGFEKKSDGSMSNGRIDAKVSQSGGSINVGTSTYTDLSGLKNSRYFDSKK